MYPFIRLLWQVRKARNAPRLAVLGTNVSHHMCWPWDIDLWWELNNGRTLTLYDLGRIPLMFRFGLVDVIRKNNWGLTIAGASVRYRRRVRMFDVVEMQSRVVFWDDRFLYIEQSMWRKDGECANHILLRAAFTGSGGIVSPAQVLQAVELDLQVPDAPDWIKGWIEADRLRPWPPMTESLASTD